MALITNLYSALAQGTLWGIMALGVYITFRILDIADLSCDGTFALGGCISAILITRGVNPFVTLLFALAGGMLAGLVTGCISNISQLTLMLTFNKHATIRIGGAYCTLYGFVIVSITVKGLLSTT